MYYYVEVDFVMQKEANSVGLHVDIASTLDRHCPNLPCPLGGLLLCRFFTATVNS